MKNKRERRSLPRIGHGEGGLVAGAMAVALLTVVGSGVAKAADASAAPATDDRPVVDLRTWPTPSLDLSKLPDNEQSRMIRMGQALITHTEAYLGPEVADPEKRYARTNTSCSSCHRASATMPFAAPLIGTYGAYPQYQPRFGRTVSLEDRINLCFTHSMAGKAIPDDSTEMKAFIAYIEYLSRGVPKGAKLIGEKEMVVEEPKRAANLVRGEQVFKQQCAVCHGVNGLGKRVGAVGDRKGYTYPPVWGPDSSSESASMFRILSAFEYIYVNMPFGQASWKRPALSKDDAYDVAGYVISHPRQPREGEVAKDFSNPYDKPPDFPWGPYVDSFNESQHKYGPYEMIRTEDAAAIQKLKQEKETKGNPASPPTTN